MCWVVSCYFDHQKTYVLLCHVVLIVTTIFFYKFLENKFWFIILPLWSLEQNIFVLYHVFLISRKIYILLYHVVLIMSSVCVCVSECVCKRAREREFVCMRAGVGVFAKERESCVCLSERVCTCECVCVCLCVCLRASEPDKGSRGTFNDLVTPVCVFVSVCVYVCVCDCVWVRLCVI